MCRLHFTFCIFVVVVSVYILVFATPKWKIQSMVVVGGVNRETMILYGALDPGQVVWTLGLGNRMLPGLSGA